MLARLAGLSTVLATSLAACGGPGGGRYAAPTDVSSDLLTRDHDAQRAVIVRDGVAYLFVRTSSASEDGQQPELDLPECWTAGESPDSCDRTAPLPADQTYQLPATLTVVGPDGPCKATVGAPVLVNTSGCEPSAMVAAPLSGCPIDVAPVGRIDDSFDPQLRWRPAPAVATVPLFADPAKLSDPVHRAAVKGWLAEDELKAGTPHEGLTARVAVDAGAEALESDVAGFLIGNGDDECQWTTGARSQVGLRRGDTLLPLEVPAEWDGAFVWRGRVVGVASGLPRDVVLHAIDGAGTTTVAFEQSVWWDNEECTQGGWAYVEYPCGP